MKKILLLFITLFFTAQTTKSQTVVLDANGVTVKWTGTTVPSPYFVQASPRGILEWFAIVDNTTKSNITDYTKNIQSGISYFTPPSSSTPIPINNIVTTLVTNMDNMFNFFPITVNTFNQPISSWDVSNVNTMFRMFFNAVSFNQPIGTWNVSSVTNMDNMFFNAVSFNQPIGAWDVSSVTNMRGMFSNADSFNQPIGAWNVSSVTNMDSMIGGTASFNQPIGTWNVSNVTSMSNMFAGTALFNQTIGSWDVSGVTLMNSMFFNALSFNQPIGTWNVSNVTSMSNMFVFAGLSTANYDALLIGWSTISPNETALKPNVVFSGGNSKYCNGANARASIISTYGWTISDGGQDSNCILDSEIFEINSIKLYPNPVLNVLNVKVDYNLINQPYNVVDGLGRVVFNGKLNDIETTINVEQLSKGIYYLKVSDKSAIKFIKE
jgi:surface protein